MMPNVALLLVLIAFLLTVVHAMGRAPLWIAVLLITVAMLVQGWR